MSLPRIIATIAFAVAAAGWSHAAGRALSVDDLVAQALADNPQLRMLEAEIASARAERARAGVWRNPEIAGSVGAKNTRDSQDVLQGTGVEFAVQLAQTLEFPGKASLRKAIADRDITLAEAACEQFVLALKARVRALAADLSASEAQAAIAGDILAEADRIATMIRERPGSGPQQAVEARLIEASLVEIRQSVWETESHVGELIGELNQLRGYPPPAKLVLSPGGGAVREPEPLQRLLLTVGEGHPAVRLRALELERASLALAAARLGTAPDVTVGPYFSRDQAGDVETSVGAALSMTIPVWDRGREAVDAARAREDRATAAVLLARREAEAEITKSHRAWERAAKTAGSVTPAQLATFREAAELAARQFRTGAIPVQLYLDMQQAYLGAVRAHHEAVAAMAGELARLEQLTAASSRRAPSPTPGRRR